MTINMQIPLALDDTGFDSAIEVIEAIGRGQIVVLVDDEDRENEGDLIAAADHADASVINFMITHGRGLVCLALTRARAEELELNPMVPRNQDHMGTAFTVSIDGTLAHGVRTGISASERAKTISLAIGGSATDIQRPGHIFPLIARDGGVVERQGHTEAAVDLATLAGCSAAGVIVEIVGPDGEMLRRDGLREFAREHGLLMSSIDLLREHVLATGAVVR